MNCLFIVADSSATLLDEQSPPVKLTFEFDPAMSRHAGQGVGQTFERCVEGTPLPPAVRSHLLLQVLLI
ncbi:MAG: hypothetical protein R3E01_32060 [Pirellulaceae bacterium]|nr:hypothetical protein [Planctomycetales bacterium]